MTSTYLEDIPAAKPGFDYILVARALANLLARPHSSATVLGVHGPWGSGKTTMMAAVRRELEATIEVDKGVYIDFNAWKFQDRQALWRALILHMLGELQRCGGEEKAIKELEQALYQAFSVEEQGPWSINWRTMIVEIIGILLSIVKLDFVANAIRDSTGWIGRLFRGRRGKDDGEDPVIDQERVERLASVLERTTVERHVQQVQSIEQFLDKFRQLIEQFQAQGRRVFVFVDDLDRCLPESALEVFESIKLFLDAPGCAYVVALDRDVIRKGLAVRYSSAETAMRTQSLIDPDEYIEKTISISYDLPRLGPNDVHTLVGDFELPVALDARHHGLLIAGLGTNPRRVKRFMNTLAMHLSVAEIAHQANLSVPEWLVTGSEPRKFDVFLKLLLIAYRYSGIFSTAVEDPHLLERLQKISNVFESKKGEDMEKARSARNLSLTHELLIVQELGQMEGFWRLIAEQPSLMLDWQLTEGLLNWFRFRSIPIATNPSEGVDQP